MKTFLMILWAVLLGTAHLTAQQIIGVKGGDGVFDTKFVSFDLYDCRNTMVESQTPGIGVASDVVFGSDGYVYGILGLGFDVLTKIDLSTGDVIQSWNIPTGYVTDGPLTAVGMAINSKGEIYLGLRRGHLFKFNTFTETFHYYGQFAPFSSSNPNINLPALTFYRDRLFAAENNSRIFAELFPETLTFDSLLTVPFNHQGLTVIEEECGKPIFISAAHPPIVAIYPDEGRYEVVCVRASNQRPLWGITRIEEPMGFFDCRDTIDLNGTLPGFDHFVINDCGESRAFIADDSARVYGAFPMDSIRVRKVEEPIGAEGSLVAPNPLLGVVSGSGSEELLASGTMEFDLWESWLRQVEYVDSSDPPAPGLRRIAVIGYYHGGERTDTAWSEIEILTQEFSAGIGGEFEECPSGETVNLFNYLTDADDGGNWEPAFPNGEIALLPQNSGAYYYIVEHGECGSDTAVVELFIWPGPDVEISGGGIYCEGSTVVLELQGDVGGATSLLWSTGSSSDRIEVTEPGTYWLRMVYGEDCIWTDTVSVDFQDRTVVQEEMGLCPAAVIDWHGQQITEVGQYETILSGIGGDCDTLLQLTVVESDYIDADLTREICPGESFEIDGTVFSEPGEFELILSAAEGCDTLLTIVVLESDYINTNLSREICPGETFEINGTVFSEPGEFELVLPATADCDTLLSIVVDWSEDIERRETVRICPGESIEIEGEFLSVEGEYEFVISSAMGCDTLLFVSLEHEVIPEAAIIGADRVCEGDEIVLRASPQEQLQQIFWNTGDMGSEIRITEGGLYSFEALTLASCGVTAEKWIEDCPSRRVYIPNAFSPNNDGVNDEWTVYTATESVELEVQIYNRWGAKVYEQKGTSISWDGIYNSEPLPAGVYVFQLRLTFSDGEVVDRVGEVVLVR